MTQKWNLIVLSYLFLQVCQTMCGPSWHICHIKWTLITGVETGIFRKILVNIMAADVWSHVYILTQKTWAPAVIMLCNISIGCDNKVIWCKELPRSKVCLQIFEVWNEQHFSKSAQLHTIIISNGIITKLIAAHVEPAYCNTLNTLLVVKLE